MSSQLQLLSILCWEGKGQVMVCTNEGFFYRKRGEKWTWNFFAAICPVKRRLRFLFHKKNGEKKKKERKKLRMCPFKEHWKLRSMIILQLQNTNSQSVNNNLNLFAIFEKMWEFLWSSDVKFQHSQSAVLICQKSVGWDFKLKEILFR